MDGLFGVAEFVVKSLFCVEALIYLKKRRYIGGSG